MNASVGAGKYEVITWLLTHIARHKLQSTLPAKTQFTFMYTTPKHTRASFTHTNALCFLADKPEMNGRSTRKMRLENASGKRGSWGKPSGRQVWRKNCCIKLGAHREWKTLRCVTWPMPHLNADKSLKEKIRESSAKTNQNESNANGKRCWQQCLICSFSSLLAELLQPTKYDFYCLGPVAASGTS